MTDLQWGNTLKRSAAVAYASNIFHTVYSTWISSAISPQRRQHDNKSSLKYRLPTSGPPTAAGLQGCTNTLGPKSWWHGRELNWVSCLHGSCSTVYSVQCTLQKNKLLGLNSAVVGPTSTQPQALLFLLCAMPYTYYIMYTVWVISCLFSAVQLITILATTLTFLFQDSRRFLFHWAFYLSF